MGFSSAGRLPCKTFSYTELLGRTRALIRRYRIYQGKSPTAGQSASNLLTCGDLCLDPRSEKVTLHQHPVDLTSTEYQILKLLLSNRRQIFSPQRLYEAIWEEPYYYGAGNTITVHIRNLRQKIEPDPSNPVYIKTTWEGGITVIKIQHIRTKLLLLLFASALLCLGLFSYSVGKQMVCSSRDYRNKSSHNAPCSTAG